MTLSSIRYISIPYISKSQVPCKSQRRKREFGVQELTRSPPPPPLMVLLQAALPVEEKKRPCRKVENFLSEKRKRKNDGEEEEELLVKEMKMAKKGEIELNLDAPLPMDWQQCLDIKSGQIHFYNTKTHRRTSTDPRMGLDPPLRSPLSLDLELNLASRVPPPIRVSALRQEKPKTDCARSRLPRDGDSDGDGSPSSWISPVSDAEEMVAAVCARCHMLVMMSKAALSCPNCKFVNRPERVFSTEIKAAVKLLCCKDL